MTVMPPSATGKVVVVAAILRLPPGAPFQIPRPRPSASAVVPVAPPPGEVNRRESGGIRGGQMIPQLPGPSLLHLLLPPLLEPDLACRKLHSSPPSYFPSQSTLRHRPPLRRSRCTRTDILTRTSADATEGSSTRSAPKLLFSG